MKMGKRINLILLLNFVVLIEVHSQDAPPSPEQLAQDAELAAQKLTGGLIQIADDQRIQNQIATSGNFADCQKDFRLALKGKPAGTIVDPSSIPNCQKIIPTKQAELEDLVKRLNPASEALKFQKDANYKAMYTYLNERLETALYGGKNPNDKSLHLVDHKNFYTLYKSQISKKFLFDTSSYCMEVFGPAFAKDNRKVDNENSDDYKKWFENELKADGGAKKIGAEFQNCLVSIPCNCYGSIDKSKYCKITDQATNKPKDISNLYVTDSKVKQQACVLSARLKELKQEMIALKEIEDGFDKLGPGNSISSTLYDYNSKKRTGSSNIDKYDPSAKDKSIDDLTLVGTEDYQKATADVEKKAQEFKKNCDQAAQLTDAKCADISSLDSNQYADVQLEYQMKTKVLAENIDKMDEDKLKEYLKNQKKTDAEITQLWADNQGKFADIKKQIKDQLATEREQIIKEIAEQINKNSVVTDGKTALNQDPTKVKKVVENQVEKTKRLIQYNNIVTAYLSTSSASGKSGHYTKGLQREIASSEGRTLTQDEQVYFKQLKNEEKTLSGSNADAPSGATLLDVSTIDNILGNAK